MKFELEFLEEFILKEYGQNSPEAGQSLVPEFAEKRERIGDEVDRIKKSFRSELFAAENELQIELFIQHHQAHIIRLADQISKCVDLGEAIEMNKISDGETKVNLCKILYRALGELLTYIETYFSKYFNQAAKIPDAYGLMESRDVREKLEFIRGIAKKKEIDPQLLQIILDPVQEFAQEPIGSGITFRKLIYFKQLIKDLTGALSSDISANYNDDVLNLMFYLNFNSYYFLTYATEKISREIQDLPSLIEQLERLSYWTKSINQQHLKPGFALKSDRSSILDQLGTWLAEEIHFIEKKKQLTLMMPPGDSFMGKDDFKVNTTPSVPQLAYTIRILKEVGIITNTNQSALIRFFSKYFTSAKNENISAESLRIKYYNPEKSTINSLQELLGVLTNQTRKDIKSIFEKLR